MRLIAAALLTVLLSLWPAAASAAGVSAGRGAGPECTGHGGGELL